MTQYTLVQPGPRQYVLDPASQIVQVTVEKRILNVSLEQSVVVVNEGDGGSEPLPDFDFLLAYQISKL